MRTKFNGKIKRFSALDASFQVEEHLSKPRLFSRTNELKLAAIQLADKLQNHWCKVLWILKGSSISQYHLWSRQSLPFRSLAQGTRCWTVTATCSSSAYSTPQTALLLQWATQLSALTQLVQLLLQLVLYLWI